MRKLFCLLFAATAAAASSVSGVTLTIACGDARYEFTEPEITKIVGCYILKNQAEVIDGIAKNEDRPAKDAEIVFSPDKKDIFTVTEAESGRKIDRDKLASDIRDALAAGGGTIRAEFSEVLPEIYPADLEGKTELRGEFTTRFHCSEERIGNIRLAAKSVSGTIIESGETFSFNAVVGERTEKRGYKTAKIIVNGEYADGVGGGVCQVSTTLYNAALYAGLTIVERHRHTLAASYVEPSFDAMVNSSSSDLKFRNDTGDKIFIQGIVGGDYVTFRIFGVKSGVSYERESEVLKRIIPKTQTVVNPELESGESRVIVAPHEGVVSEGYLSAYSDGKLLWRKKISEDSYLAVNGITEVGE